MTFATKKTELPSFSPHEIPGLRGQLRMHADIAKNTWFQVGGVAECLFKPEDTQDLQLFLSHLPPEIPITVLGVGSNILIRDGGIKGVVIRLGRGFTQISVEGDSIVAAGAACLDLHVANFAADIGIGGLEFLSGIPGTLGGAIMMNAGAYSSDISETLLSTTMIDRSGMQHTLTARECDFAYRTSTLPLTAIVVSARLQGAPDDVDLIKKRMESIQTQREATQPIRAKTGGSTFKNPEGKQAWALIDAAGCRGLKIGNAQVSDKHCNFLINTGNATAAQLEALGEEVRKRVFEHSGIMLEWEIKRLGDAM